MGEVEWVLGQDRAVAVGHRLTSVTAWKGPHKAIRSFSRFVEVRRERVRNKKCFISGK